MENKENGWILVYEARSIPDGKTMREIQIEAEAKGVIVWDSSKGGGEPCIIHLGGDKNEYLKDCKIIDVFGK